MVHRNIENGKNFEVNLENGEQTEKLTLGFAFSMQSLSSSRRDQFETLGNASDTDSSDDASPFHQPTSIRAQLNAERFRKVVRVDLYRPNFATRHRIELGNVEVPMPTNGTALFWNRRVIFEANKDTGNYHAFLYANVGKNGRNNRNSKKMFMGYAPLLRIGQAGVEEAATAPATEQQQHGTSEYQVTIPVKFAEFFKHKLWNLKVFIYQFKELPSAGQNRSATENDQNEEETCPICLDSLQLENRQIIKLHGKRTNYEHKYHADCITRWIESKEMLRCPLCLTDPKLIIVADFAPIFFDSTQIYHKMYVNPTAQLFKMANSDENGRFSHGQALHAFANIRRKMEQAERAVKRSLATMEVPLLMDKLFGEMFFEVGFNGFGEKQSIENVRKELETIVELNFTQNMMGKAKETLKLINGTRAEAESEATAALETIQMIGEEAEGEGEGEARAMEGPTH
ncbi:hypothetical protein niasHT_009806 [Heterodera trifolii]|uniref:RING-type domain-containing protein n=1 Tax=Heterodera trifolii TaxID=157864 RepID=A0ABD2MDY6_9BILA